VRRQLWGRTGALEQVKASKDRLPFQNFGDIRVQTKAEAGDIISSISDCENQERTQAEDFR